MKLPLYIVDAFTLRDNEPFTGNAAAVCILQYDDDITDEIKQKIASEMNISETAFVANAWHTSNLRENSSSYTLRWFTPTIEVDLCGHATLATASVLFERIKQTNNAENNFDKLKFETKHKGFLEAMINRSQNSISLNFPSNDCVPLNRKNNSWIEDIIQNIMGSQLNIDYIQDIQYSSEAKKLLLRLKDSPESEKLIYKVSPNFDKLLKIETNDMVRGVIVTQRSDNLERVDFLSRYFAPWNGINEDPVTGSAHTVLAPYWKRQFDEYGIETNGELVGEQCSLRKGIVLCKIIGDRIQLTGNSRIVFEGELTI